MKKRMIALLLTGVLFSLTVGIGCGKAAVENIASKKTEAVTAEEGRVLEGDDAGQKSQDGAEPADGGALEGDRAEPESRDGAEPAESKTEEGETEKQMALREKLGVPERISAPETNEGGVVRIIDAAVSVPDADSFVITSAESKTFGDSNMKTLVEPVLGEGGLYRLEPEGYEFLVSQGALLRRRLEQGDYEGEEERQNLEQTLETTEACIREMEGEVQKTKLALRMTIEEKLNSGQYVEILEGFTDWEQRTMHVGISRYGMILDSWPMEEQSRCTISKEQAEAVAEAYVERMGLSEELVLDFAGENEGMREDAGYVFAYVRTLGGVPVGYSGSKGLNLTVDDRGVRRLGYGDYVIGQEGKPAELLPFSEIQKIFEETSIRIFCEPGELKKISVDEIRLVYRFVPVSEWSSVSGHLVPAWEAFGTYQVLDENGVLRDSNPADRECLLAVSAVDGRILAGAEE